MAIVYLALGSNLGDRKGYLCKAIEALKENGVNVYKVSKIIETNPVGGPEQGKFLNAVLKSQTHLAAEELHVITRAIEKNLGRTRKIANGPRVIDIDILLYDDIKLVTKRLIIPHPRMLEREFVMRPLREIAPHVCVLLET